VEAIGADDVAAPRTLEAQVAEAPVEPLGGHTTSRAPARLDRPAAAMTWRAVEGWRPAGLD
jgi:hypothetical protein